MKFTKNDLLEARAMRAAQAVQAEKKRELEYQAWKLKQEAEHMEQVRTAFDSGLSALLLDTDKKGITCLHLQKGSVYEMKTYGSSIVCDPKFKLDFDPAYDYEPTRKLLRMLEEAGFKASVSSRQVEDITWVNDCVGFEGLGTYHAEHYIVVSW